MSTEARIVQLPETLACCQGGDIPGGYCQGARGCDRSSMQYAIMRSVVERTVIKALEDTELAITKPKREDRQARVSELLKADLVKIDYVPAE